MLFTTIVLLFVISCIRAAVIPRPHDSNVHENGYENEVYDPLKVQHAWHQPADHPVHSLFRRDIDDTVYTPVGSADWATPYPPGYATPNQSLTPPEWLAVLNNAVAAGKIPNIPQTTLSPAGLVTYPAGVDPTSPEICSGDVQCEIPGDIWNGPDGIYSSTFDDGPYPQTTTLVQFLQAQNLTTTHFMIGSNIIANPTEFLLAFNAGHDIGCHTWSHPYMTTKSNEDVVAELGWTMQLIHNSTGGRVPKYWRPPYGDTDQRTSAIAKYVFGLETVVWNQDSQDWAQSSADPVTAAITQIVSTSPKSPGLITLEHEISDPDVDGFIAAFPAIAANGWNFVSLARALNNGTYQNADSSTSPVTEKVVFADSQTATSSSATPSLTSSSATPSASHQTSSSSSLLLSHESPRSRLFLTFILCTTIVFLTL